MGTRARPGPGTVAARNLRGLAAPPIATPSMLRPNSSTATGRGAPPGRQPGQVPPRAFGRVPRFLLRSSVTLGAWQLESVGQAVLAPRHDVLCNISRQKPFTWRKRRPGRYPGKFLPPTGMRMRYLIDLECSEYGERLPADVSHPRCAARDRYRAAVAHQNASTRSRICAHPACAEPHLIGTQQDTGRWRSSPRCERSRAPRCQPDERRHERLEEVWISG